MPETDEVETTDTDQENTDATDTESAETEVETEQSEQQEDPAEKLKKALRAEREARKAAERERNQFKQQLADKEKDADQIAAEEAARAAEQAALAKANARVVRSELKAAAAGKVSRPDLLVKVTDLSTIDVDDNGDPDPDALNDAIAAFLEDYPELAADKSKFPGSADQGSKGKQTQKRQLTREDIKSMTPEQILKAQNAGLLNDVLGGKS